MIKIVDYGLGNISAFSNMYKRLNIPAVAVRTAAELEGATKIILPGVGAFDHAMELLDESGMRPTLEHLVQQQQVPVLGICVGMQILVESSDEGDLPGLGWIPGRLCAFRNIAASAALPTPHMGWNDVAPAPGCPLFRGMEEQARFYFLHSYFFEGGEGDNVVATAQYGLDFGCAVQAKNVYGVQFHPEKSHHWGAMLLRNFAEL